MKIRKNIVINSIALLLCLLPVMTWATSYEVSTSTKIVDGDTFCGGSACTSSDTIIIKGAEGGSRGSLRFQNFNGKGSYITIKNENTKRVIITHNSTVGRGVLSFDNCKYIVFRGNNNTSFKYGIKVVNDGSPNTPAGTVWVYGKSHHIKLSYLEISNTASASGYYSNGISVQDANLTNSWTFDTFEIHHNYIHDTLYAGMYLGHNSPHDQKKCAGGCPYLASFSIHNNVFEDIGSYGFNLKGVNGPNNYIYNNTVKVTGLNCGGGNCYNSDGFSGGIKVMYTYANYYVEIYKNRIEKTVGAGLQIAEANHLVHDNLILGCGTGNSSTWGHGIALLDSDDMPGRLDRRTKVYQNKIVESTRYGIQSNGGSANHYKNLIAESGIGEVCCDFRDLNEGTGTNANIYEADADDMGFNVWIDDGDYSNDDFSLSKIPPATELQIVK